MIGLTSGRHTARYQARHARISRRTVVRSAICCAALAGLALSVGIPAAGGPAGTARAGVPHESTQPAVGGQQSPPPTGLPAAQSAQSDAPAATRATRRQHGGAPINDRFAASALAADGIPVTALIAYRNAAARAASSAPSCGITWPLLAGIGRVESDHGRFAGAVLHSNGLSTPPVIGIPLNGHGTALIRDTDNGALDGDTVYDRAVGPMQFIPSTWAGWGVDGNGDGLRDPFNIFDAAAAAADYLCAAGHDLTTLRGQVLAILSYNWSWDYVRMVMGVEKVYATGVGITVPVLPTTPDRHRLTAAKPTLPPVNPGPPAATRSVRRSAPAPDRTTSAPGPTHTTTHAAPSSTASSAQPSGGGTTSTSSSPGGSSSSGSTGASQPNCPTDSSSPAPGDTSSAPVGCPSSSDSSSSSTSPAPQPSSASASSDPSQSP